MKQAVVRIRKRLMMLIPTLALVFGAAFVIQNSLFAADPPVAAHEIVVDTITPTGDTVGNNENILYEVRGNTNDAPATNVVVTLTAENAVFDVIPTICKQADVEPVSEILSNGATLICNTGNWEQGSSFRITVEARALGPNGEKANIEATVSSDNSDTASGMGIEKEIVADYKSDIMIQFDGALGSYSVYNQIDTDNEGEPGMVVPLHWRVAVLPGSENPTTGFTADITLSSPDNLGFPRDNKTIRRVLME